MHPSESRNAIIRLDNSSRLITKSKHQELTWRPLL